MNDQRLCPFCSGILDAFASLEGDPRPPRAGDITLCGFCNSMLRFETDITLRELTPAEWERVAAEMKLRGLSSLIPRRPSLKKPSLPN